MEILEPIKCENCGSLLFNIFRTTIGLETTTIYKCRKCNWKKIIKSIHNK